MESAGRAPLGRCESPVVVAVISLLCAEWIIRKKKGLV